MSFVPAPQKATAAGNGASNNAAAPGTGTPRGVPAAGANSSAIVSDNPPAEEDSTFKVRTFDVLWVDRAALMYKDGIAKVSVEGQTHCLTFVCCECHPLKVAFLFLFSASLYIQTFDKEIRKATIVVKRKSSIPIILRDMAPPEGSTFDPAKKWAEEKERRERAKLKVEETLKQESEESDKKKKSSGQKKGGGKKSSGGISAADIKAKNVLDMGEKDYEQDMQKLSNLKTLVALQNSKCETAPGKVNRMIKMLHLAVSDLKNGSVTASEAEVLDILWALEEMGSFQNSENLLSLDKAQRKEEKESDKKASKSKSKDDKKSKKKDKESKDKGEEKGEEKKEKVMLTSEAKSLKELLKDGGDNRGSFKDSLKYARKLMLGKKDLISFQLTEMHDRLPPLSKYNRQFKLEDWQCDILRAIDDRQSAVVAAPTSSGKTLLSTYTCKNAKGTVLFVLPSEVLVWQIAATYYDFFKGNVTICTDQICFQEITGDAQVYIGTPRALERALTKARGIAGQEMIRGEKEFMVLDGGFNQFDFMVLDEVHTMNGPEGDALQRLIKANTCPCLALSATIGNAEQLRGWFQSLREEQMDIINAGPEPIVQDPSDVMLKEVFSRFINLQRWVVGESESKDGKKKQKLVKLHPMAAMTPERLENASELVAALSMTPTDMMDLWTRLRSIFPSTVLEEMDNPDHFFLNHVDKAERITLAQTKEYETHLKKRLSVLSNSHPELYERLRVSHLPPALKSKKDVGDSIYGVVKQLKESDMLPCVAFQLSTYGAFNMFKRLLSELEKEQLKDFPDYRKDLIKMARDKAQMRKVAAGKASRENAAEAEEEAKAGFEDDLNVSDDTTKPHDKYILTSAAKRMSYNEVEDVIADMKKSGEPVDINHALIRGLRRGVAIYTNEVGFSCYRRQVQILAQKGRLAVVFSDSALAYGVNMPFRSCLFCGDMGDELTPLIAQQMQGRAGRRGMDVQGNVIYLGMEWPYIENLMLGQISQITGKNPRYPMMALQRALAASNDPDDAMHFVHDDNEEAPFFADSLRKRERVKKCHSSVTDAMMKRMGDTTLAEYCEDQKNDDSYLEASQNTLVKLGWTEDGLVLKASHNVMSMVWEMKEYPAEAIHLYGTLEHMYMRFCYNKTKSFKDSDATQNDFLAVLVHVVDRIPCRDGEESLQQMLRVEQSPDKSTPLNEEAIVIWQETEACLIKQDLLLEDLELSGEDKEAIRLELRAGGGDNESGPALDRGVYEMLSSKQKGFPETVSVERRNELKNRIVKMGQICLIAHNNLQQPHSKYNAMESHFRRMFSNIKYSVADMMKQLTDQPDLTDI
jgi:hypothetical protein